MILVLGLLLAAVVVALLAIARRVPRAPARWGLRIAAAVVALPLLLLLVVVGARVRNDRRLARFAAQLDDFRPPPGARVVHRLAAVGLITGNGNHCDFLARHEVATSLPLAFVEAHYARLRLRPAIDGGADGGRPWVSVEPRQGGGYVVTLIDAPYSAGFDERCH